MLWFWISRLWVWSLEISLECNFWHQLWCGSVERNCLKISSCQIFITCLTQLKLYACVYTQCLYFNWTEFFQSNFDWNSHHHSCIDSMSLCYYSHFISHVILELCEWKCESTCSLLDLSIRCFLTYFTMHTFMHMCISLHCYSLWLKPSNGWSRTFHCVLPLHLFREEVYQ